MNNEKDFLATKKNEARDEILKRIKQGDFVALAPMLEMISPVLEHERSEIVMYWLQNGLPGSAKSYTEALTFGDLEAIKLADAVLSQNKGQER